MTCADSYYKTLALRYRPQLMDEIIGQEVLVKTLKNIFKTKQIPHVFVLTGMHGVGKTSSARIIAKTIECEYANSDNNPCNTCPNCEAITIGNHPDVLETDGATNNSVEDIKTLIEILNNYPIKGKYKVVIIDEAQMLSNSAWNASLKTFEEPPENTYFVITTTNIKKIPNTILSRAMIFKLISINTECMLDRACTILDKEKINYELSAVRLIAAHSQGSMRNFLYLVEQVANFGDGQITTPSVQKIMNKVNTNTIWSLLLCIVNRDKKQILKIVEELLNYNVSAKNILHQLMEIMHDCILMREDLAKDSLLSKNETTCKVITEVLEKVTLDQLYRMWAMLQQQLRLLHYSHNPQNTLIIILFSLTYSLSIDSFCINKKKETPNISESNNTSNRESQTTSQNTKIKDSQEKDPSSNNKPELPTSCDKTKNDTHDDRGSLNTEILELFPDAIIKKEQ